MKLQILSLTNTALEKVDFGSQEHISPPDIRRVRALPQAMDIFVRSMGNGDERCTLYAINKVAATENHIPVSVSPPTPIGRLASSRVQSNSHSTEQSPRCGSR